MEVARLDGLGWADFEHLCQSLLFAMFGSGIEAWGGTGDLGRDAYSESDLKLEQDFLPGPVVFQAKFVSNASAAQARPAAALRSAVDREIIRIETRTAKDGKAPGSYVLMTNVPIQPTQREEIAQRIKSLYPSAKVEVWGGLDIVTRLRKYPAIRKAFPRIMGLEDLEVLLGSSLLKGVEVRSKVLLESAQDIAKVFVETEAYHKANIALDRSNYVVLSGPPEAGKTAMSYVLALERASQGYEVVHVRKPDDAFFTMLADETSTIFLADDFFGSNAYVPDYGEAWSRDLHLVFGLLRPTKQIIFTSRTAPLKIALNQIHLQPQVGSFPKTGEVVVDISQLNETVRSRMVLNHAKDKALTTFQKEVMKASAHRVIWSDNFTPLRVKRFIDALSSVREEASDAQTVGRDLVARFISNPTEQMRKSFEQLDEAYRLFLISTLDFDFGFSFDELSNLFEKLGPPENRPSKARIWEALEDHYLRLSPYRTPSEATYELAHPTWRDLLISYLADQKGLRHKFLRYCGFRGIGLAFAIGGGAAGDKFAPLLLSAEDYEPILENLKERSTNTRTREWSSVLNSIVQLYDAKGNFLPGFMQFVRQILELASEALTSNRDYYEPQPTNLEVFTYVQLAIRIENPTVFPAGEVFRERRSELWDSMVWWYKGSSRRSSFVSKFNEWLELRQIVLDHPECFEDQMTNSAFSQKLARIGTKLLVRGFQKFRPSEDFESFYYIREMSNLIRIQFPTLAKQCDALDKEIGRFDADLELWQEEEKYEALFRAEEDGQDLDRFPPFSESVDLVEEMFAGL